MSRSVSSFDKNSNLTASSGTGFRYHQRPSVPATIYDVLAGLRKASKLVKRNGIEMVHARGHIPATIALGLKKRFGTKMIFDVRGLMAEEYVDAEHWREGGIPYRITKATERRILAATDAIVTLDGTNMAHHQGVGRAARSRGASSSDSMLRGSFVVQV